MHKRIHFIGIGETVMAGLSMALHKQGCIVTGNIKKGETEGNIASSLNTQNSLINPYILPKSNLDSLIECVIIGREIDEDNIELIAAKELGLPIYSYTEYIYHYAKDKQRVVVTGGSKTRSTILSMAIYVMDYWKRSFNYVASTAISNTPVKLSTDAPVIFLEGDTYPISATDRRVQVLVYEPHIMLMSSIDMEYCKTDILLSEYMDIVRNLSDALPKAGSLIYHTNIASIKEIAAKPQIDVKHIPYQEHDYKKIGNLNYLLTHYPPTKDSIPHTNKLILESISATYYLLKELAITQSQFCEAIADFIAKCNNVPSA
jgi:UDP-N-acetylmuramate: L-alanyl-gamma-D-glutamyl-meso-diaminopimelate ligase